MYHMVRRQDNGDFGGFGTTARPGLELLTLLTYVSEKWIQIERAKMRGWWGEETIKKIPKSSEI